MFYAVYDREENGYHDSYFHAGFFNPETKEFFEQEYGSTAFPTAARHLKDLNGKLTRFVKGVRQEIEFVTETPPSIIALYRRVARIRQHLEYRKEMQEIAKELHLDTYHEAIKLTNAFPNWRIYKWQNLDYFEFKAVFDLLKTKNFRSNFRKSLADQVRNWLKESEPRFHKPLSQKQLSFIVRR